MTTVEEALEDYNATYTKKMPLVMFLDAVSHVAHISRIIRQPLGNALLLGVGGSGRQARRLTLYPNPNPSPADPNPVPIPILIPIPIPNPNRNP